MNLAGLRFLRHCFSEEEWDLLTNVESFREHLQMLASVDEAERLIPLALSILQDATDHDHHLHLMSECWAA